MARKNFRRRPNGSGSVVKLSGNRRKPYGARVFNGYNAVTGMPLQKFIGYFETWEEANNALTLYNLQANKEISASEIKDISPKVYEEMKKNKDKNIPTFADIFEILYETKYHKLTSANTKRSHFNSLTALHNLKINVITLRDMQTIFDELKSKNMVAGTLSLKKCICTDIFKYAVINHYITRDDDYSEFIDVSTDFKKEQLHKPFSIQEINSLISSGSRTAKIILIYIFTGCRPIELYTLKKEDIHIDVENDDDGILTRISYIVTGSKTDAGMNRNIPIHNLIKPYIIDLLNENNDYLFFNIHSNYKSYKNCYSSLFNDFMKSMNFNHTPYDTRHTFATLAKLYKVDPYSRKKIMGHKSNDITDDVYTHSVLNKLFTEIQKIDLK